MMNISSMATVVKLIAKQGSFMYRVTPDINTQALRPIIEARVERTGS